MFDPDPKAVQGPDARRQAASASPEVSVESILNEAPFGIRVTRDADIVFSNPIGRDPTEYRQRPGHEQRTLDETSFAVSINGTSYTLSLLLDETDRVNREQSLMMRAYFDEVTGLPNKRLFEQSVDALIGSGQGQFAIAFIDIDELKHVNDFFGHEIGDQLLVQISKRIGETLRPTDMLARLGGDEFLLLISPSPNQETLSKDLAAIVERVNRPYFIGHKEIITSVSIGVGIYPRDGASYSALQSNADRALHRSKASGSGRIQFFNDTIQNAVIERARLEERLRLAISEQRVICAYQPKVDILNGSVFGVELLMRWIDENGVTQPPGEFISLAMDLGLLDDLAFLMLDKTMQSIDQINEAFGPTTSISFNVAAKQAGDVGFMRRLLDTMAETGIANRFILEITEEAFVSRKQFQDQVLPLIRKIGARVSIDDFGVGYSSLSALADITADEVKIDRSFIREIHQRPRNQMILKAVEALSGSLGMSIIVEGVETFEELVYLRTCTGIRHAQGYYFAKPLLLHEMSSRYSHSVRPHVDTRPEAKTRSVHT